MGRSSSASSSRGQLPHSYALFLEDEEVETRVTSFMDTFFSLYDGDRSLDLEYLYAPQALFSLTVDTSFAPDKSTLVEEYLPKSHNLGDPKSASAEDAGMFVLRLLWHGTWLPRCFLCWGD